MSFFDSSLTEGAITREVQKRIPDFFADLEEVSREVCAAKAREEDMHPANEAVFQAGLELVTDSLADIETPVKEMDYIQQPLLNVIEGPSEELPPPEYHEMKLSPEPSHEETVPADPITENISGVDAFFGGIYGVSGSQIPALRRKHSFVASQTPYFDSDLGMRLGLIYESEEKTPKGGVYDTIKEGLEEVKAKSASPEVFLSVKDKYAEEGSGIIRRAAKKLDKKKLPKADALDTEDYVKESSDGRRIISGKYLETFKAALKADIEAYRGLGVSKDVVKHLEAMGMELVLGKRNASHIDAKKNKAVFYLSFDRLSLDERKRLRNEGLSDKDMKNLEVLSNAYRNSLLRHAVLNRAASNFHVRNSLVNMQADTGLGDLSDGLCAYFALEGITGSGALKSLSLKDRKNLWKILFSNSQMDAACFEQYQMVSKTLKPEKGGRKKKPGKEELELSKLPKHLQRMVKGRIYLSSDELAPYKSVKEVKECGEKFRQLRSRMVKATTKEKALMYPEAAVIKLLVTIETAQKNAEQSDVVKESYSLLGDIIQAFDTNKKGKVSDGFVYNTYKNILPKVCGG